MVEPSPRTRSAPMIVLVLTAAAVAAEPVAPWPRHAIDDSSRGADGVRLADVNGDGLPDVATGWEEGGVTRVYVNPGPAKVRAKWPAITVGKTPSVEDAVLVDGDGDGALDVVSCCEGGTRSIFIHWAPKERSNYLKPGRWTQHPLPAAKGRMQWMFAAPAQLDGKHGVDLVAGGKNAKAAVGWFEAPADPRDLAGFTWHPITPAGWIMTLLLTDMDGDGDADVLITDRRGGLRGCRWLENPGPGPAQAEPWPNHFVGGRDDEVLFMKYVDLDGDGLADALVAGRKRILQFRRLDRGGLQWEPTVIAYPANAGGGKAVAAGDFNGDGRMDIACSSEGATGDKLGLYWMERRGDGPSAPWVVHDIAGIPGIKFDRMETLDLDGDGDLDIMTCEEREGKGGLGVIWYENPQKDGMSACAWRMANSRPDRRGALEPAAARGLVGEPAPQLPSSELAANPQSELRTPQSGAGAAHD